jgi:hypothetical protein
VITGPGFQDHRPFLVKLIDPFDLMELVKVRSRKRNIARIMIVYLLQGFVSFDENMNQQHRVTRIDI